MEIILRKEEEKQFLEEVSSGFMPEYEKLKNTIGEHLAKPIMIKALDLIKTKVECTSETTNIRER